MIFEVVALDETDLGGGLAAIAKISMALSAMLWCHTVFDSGYLLQKIGAMVILNFYSTAEVK